MKVKFKFIESYSATDLEEKLETFSEGKDIVDVKFSTNYSLVPLGDRCEKYQVFHALVLWR